MYVRGLDRAEATPVSGDRRRRGPFFSPDGAWIGFWADNTIKKVPAAGGPPATICDVPAGGGWGASWGEDGTIFFASSAGIFKVSAAGGTPATVTTPDAAKGERHLLPHAARRTAILFTTVNSGDWETANVVLQSLDSGEQRVLIPGGADARYVSTGHLVYMKTGTLMAVPFDVRSRQVTGAPVALIEGVMQGVNAPNSADETGAGQFAVSASGTLLYAAGASVQFARARGVGRQNRRRAAAGGRAGRPVYVSASLAQWKENRGTRQTRGRAEPPTCGCTTSFAVRRLG